MAKTKIRRKIAYEIKSTGNCTSVVTDIQPSELKDIKKGKIPLERVGTAGKYIMYRKAR